MRVIDILNKISKGEEVPKRIKCDGEEYKITKVLLEDNNYWLNYINEDMECIFPTNTNHLNDEVEIIEKDKKELFKVNTYLPSHQYMIEDRTIDIETRIKELNKKIYNSELYTLDLANTLNEIIDYLNKENK